VPYVITDACIDVMDRSCMDECPVDCIYEGKRKLYINPAECIDCGACEPACPVTAISLDTKASGPKAEFADDNARFFEEPLPGRDEAIGAPGGAAVTGPIGVDTDLVTGFEVAG
jgi:NAD-dependent dihydropyrimidine dehydrogenase PreA subunit